MTHIQDINAGIEGFVKIVDLDTNRVIREGKNSVHKENMSQTLAEVMSSGNSIVSEIHFGDGATTINTGVITYKPANILGENAGLYHPLYYRLVDSLDFGNVLPSDNKVETSHIKGSQFTDLVVTTTLDYADPDASSQTGGFITNLTDATYDAGLASGGEMIFDEIGLKSRGITGLDSGRLLTHYRFHPVTKTAEQRIQIIYTLRIRA